MTDDVPAQITIFPPSSDIETSYWGSLAPTLWHAGLIWRDYEQVAFNLNPVELRIWCTFTDREAFNAWRQHELVAKRCPEILASKIEVTETTTPWARHDERCTCEESSAFGLNGHGFGNRKSVLYCCDCLGYFPNHRTLELIGNIYGQLHSWALISGHVYDIWMLTADLENWALNELRSPTSELNSSRREFARLVRERTGKQVWYCLFVQSDAKTDVCPACNRQCTPAKWSHKRFVCYDCNLVY